MTAPDLIGARIALRWSTLLTATAPTGAGGERHAEIASDVFEQVAAARAAGQSDTRLSGSIASRALRGIPSDVAWRVRLEAVPERWGWHLRHPSTPLTCLFVATAPINLLADAGRLRVPALFPVFAGLWAVTLVMCLVLLAFAAVAGTAWVRVTNSSSAKPLPAATRLSRWVTAIMAISWALSVIGRFAPGSPLYAISTLAWAVFGVSLLAYVVLVLARASTKFLTLGR
jgi:hypothetical protein